MPRRRRRRQKQLGDPTRVVGYIRVSTEDQALGPEAQEEALRRWCARFDLELCALYAEDISGAAPLGRRQALLLAVEALEEHGAGVLLVAKRDRLSRDVETSRVVERLVDERGARVVSADGVSAEDTPEASLMRGMVDQFAEYERRLISARTTAALAVKQARSERTGTVRYGYRIVPDTDPARLEEDPDEQATLVRILELAEEGRSLRSIADALDAEGRLSRVGRRWHPTSLARLIDRAEAVIE